MKRIETVKEAQLLGVKSQEFIFLFTGITLIALHLQGDIGSILGIAVLPLLYLERSEYDIDNRVYTVFVLIILYLFTFTLISENAILSFKAGIEILRSIFICFVGWLFCKRLESTKFVWLMSLILFLAVLGNLFFSKKFGYFDGVQREFFSYHNDPNKSAFMYAFHFTFAGILLLWSRRKFEKIINVLSILLCLFFIYLTNSRSVWVALAVSTLFFVWFTFKSSKSLRNISVLMLSCVFLVFAIFFNVKGFSLSYRDIIWKALIRKTVDDSLFFGFGINTNKELLKTIQLDYLAVGAHNSLVEIFSSSGLVGIVFMMIIGIYLAKILMSKDDKFNSFYNVGVCGLICFLVISFFDFKFFSFRFFSTVWVFIGFSLYGISRNKRSARSVFE